MLKTCLATLIGLCACCAASAEEVTRSPLPAGHPLIGLWRLEMPDHKCFEEYDFHTDGTVSVTSGEERGDSDATVVAIPGSTGLYKWTDKVTTSNGKLDCSGATTPVGDVAVNYIRVHPDGNRFLMCGSERTNSCFAELTRQPRRADR